MNNESTKRVPHLCENFCQEIHPRGKDGSAAVWGCLNKPDHAGDHYCEAGEYWATLPLIPVNGWIN